MLIITTGMYLLGVFGILAKTDIFFKQIWFSKSSWCKCGWGQERGLGKGAPGGQGTGSLQIPSQAGWSRGRKLCLPGRPILYEVELCELVK